MPPHNVFHTAVLYFLCAVCSLIRAVHIEPVVIIYTLMPRWPNATYSIKTSRLKVVIFMTVVTSLVIPRALAAPLYHNQ